MISLGALAAWVVIVHLEARQLALRDAERNAAVVAHAIAREQERLIDTAKQLLVGLSQRQEVLTANAGPCNVLFAGVVKGFPGYLDLVAVKSDGQVFCAARPPAGLPGSTDPRDIARTIESGSPTLGRYGCREEIFTPDAVSAIHQATQGIPRQINDLGDSAMMWARLHQTRPVDAAVVERVLSTAVR
jgi:hypothetical protein